MNITKRILCVMSFKVRLGLLIGKIVKNFARKPIKIDLLPSGFIFIYLFIFVPVYHKAFK